MINPNLGWQLPPLQEALAAPCYSAWLAITGRALLSVGRAFRVALSWLQYCMERSSAGRTHEGVIVTLSLHASAMEWLLEQMQALQVRFMCEGKGLIG